MTDGGEFYRKARGIRVAIMQPYFFPYIGYFQLIAAADVFVVYDNIKYTKKGWINRNRMLQNGSDVTFSLPLKRDSDSLNIVERTLASDFDRARLLRQFKGAYQRAPHFAETYALLEQIVGCKQQNLFQYVYHALSATCAHLGIGTQVIVSSSIPIDRELRAQDKVVALCQALNADTYINSIGGRELYSYETFKMKGIELAFLKPKPFEYSQGDSTFVPWLSIVDVLMFNPLATVRECIARNYELV